MLLTDLKCRGFIFIFFEKHDGDLSSSLILESLRDFVGLWGIDWYHRNTTFVFYRREILEMWVEKNDDADFPFLTSPFSLLKIKTLCFNAASCKYIRVSFDTSIPSCHACLLIWTWGQSFEGWFDHSRLINKFYILLYTSLWNVFHFLREDGHHKLHIFGFFL